MLSLFSLVIIATTQPEVGWPAFPDFKRQVDYVKWYEGAVRRDRAPAQNAFELYRVIFPNLADPDVEPPENYGFAGYRHEKNEQFKGGPWRPADFPKWEQSYQRNRKTLETFRQAAARPYRLVPNEDTNPASAGLSGMQPNNKGIRACVKGLSEAAWRAENGSINATRFLDYCEAALGAAQQLDREPHVNSYLEALLARSLVYDDLRDALAYGVLKPQDRSNVLKMLHRLDGELPNLSLMLKGECASIYDYLQAVAAGKGGNESWDQAARISLQIGWAEAKKTAEAFRKYFGAVDELSRRP